MVVLPSGIVPFPFTDTEGSTRLWEEFPDAMRVALAQHDGILTDAVESHGGMVFKHTGDGMCAVFTVVGDAIAAALQAQIGLSQADWGAVGSVKARMGVHTGQVEEHDGDYFGPPLNRTARLMSTGHGGQVLLSGVAADLAQGHLPDRTELKSLGTHRLRDLSNAEDVSLLLHPEFPAEFPPILSLDFFQGNLPPQLTSFIGREEEILQVNALLNDTRILTLTGIGGTGKTRLALEIGVQRIEDFSDGVWLVDLAPLTDPEMVRSTIASTFGIPEEGFHDYIKSKNALIIMDNCEHVLDASAQAVQRLLQVCPKVNIVATSREAPGVPGEVIHRVLSLSTPETSDETFAAASKCEAVQLFVDRAMSVQPGFALSPENAASISQIARRLDGIPLAIELAAARIKSLPVDQVALRLDDRFRLLTSGSRTALPRQRTLLAAIEWSYELLTPEEVELLTRLAVFQGGFSIEAAEHLGVPEGEFSGDVLDLLLQLVDKSLVTGEPWDTDAVPFDSGVAGSRTTRMAVPAAYDAALDAQAQLLQIAAQRLGISLENLQCEAGVVRQMLSGAETPWSDLVAASPGGTVMGRAESKQVGQPETTAFVAQVAEVSVDLETGEVKLLKFTSAHDVGTVLNPVGHLGQIAGGVIMGVGYATMEELQIEDGHVTSLTFGDVKIPNIRDIPQLVTRLVDSGQGTGPYRAKSIGESPVLPVAPAIANAIRDAVGVRMRSLPITAERVYRALRK